MNVQFDKTKALNALLYVANRVQRKDFHKIFKIVYFADRQHLAEWGRPITGDTYIAMDAGPVPSRMYDMLKIVRGDSYLPDTEGLGKFFKVVNTAAERSGKSKAFCFFDILRCMKRYQAGYNDYVIFEWWDLTHEQRDTYMTRFRSKKFIMFMNDHSYSHYFDNKNEFNEKFKDFIGRECLDLETATHDEIVQFFETRDKTFA